MKNRFWGTAWKKFLGFVTREKLIQKGDRILALVSGGPDSTAMACWLKLLSRRIPFQMVLFHMDHGLRKGSAREARAVAALALRLGIPFYSQKIPVLKLASQRRAGLEEAGRRLRYEHAEKLARRLRFNKAATAHTLDEQAETVLLNMLRGGGLKGLAGTRKSRPIRHGSRIRLIRPMLEVRKAEVLEYLRREAVPYLEDPSNRDPRFLRSRIRLELMPLLLKLQPRAAEHLARLAAEADMLMARAGN